MLRVIVILGLSMSIPAASMARAEKYVPAKWRQELLSTTLAGDDPAEYLVRSNISTGVSPRDASIGYSIAVKVESVGKMFTATEKYHRRGSRYEESLRVKLSESKSAQEITVDFEHIVLKDGEVILRFAGITLLFK